MVHENHSGYDVAPQGAKRYIQYSAKWKTTSITYSLVLAMVELSRARLMVPLQGSSTSVLLVASSAASSSDVFGLTRRRTVESMA